MFHFHCDQTNGWNVWIFLLLLLLVITWFVGKWRFTYHDDQVSQVSRTFKRLVLQRKEDLKFYWKLFGLQAVENVFNVWEEENWKDWFSCWDKKQKVALEEEEEKEKRNVLMITRDWSVELHMQHFSSPLEMREKEGKVSLNILLCNIKVSSFHRLNLKIILLWA